MHFIDLGALLEAPAHAVDRALAGLWFGRKGAVTSTVTLLAQACPVLAISVLAAVVQASTNIASIARPAWVAVARAFNALAVAVASLAVTRAATRTVVTTPTILARADAVKALAVATAVVGARLLRTVVSLVTLVALARHLRSNRHALSVARA